MNADAFRHVYGYHFAENHKIWAHIASLSEEQFNQAVNYSVGSVRKQIVHLMDVDDVWFSGLRGMQGSDLPDPSELTRRDDIRAHWDKVEAKMRDYLANLRDELLFEKPIPEGEDKDLIAWQILLHVVTHGVDHRAQLLRLLHDFGCNTIYQDYIFHAYGNP